MNSHRHSLHPIPFIVMVALILTVILPYTTTHEENRADATPATAMAAESLSVEEVEVLEVIVPVDFTFIVESDSRYAEVFETLTHDRARVLALITYEEAGNQSDIGKQAVMEVVLNRVVMEGWPDTIEDVVFASNPVQFVPAYKINGSTKTDEELFDIYRIMYSLMLGDTYVLEKDYVYFSTGRLGCATDFVKIGDHYFGRSR